jgi:hypothetical protein
MITPALIAGSVAVVMIASIVSAHPAFALQHFFNCITDISNKDGGDHNLTARQVLDCFQKEFPNNDQSLGGGHFSSHSSDHIHSQIIQGFSN